MQTTPQFRPSRFLRILAGLAVLGPLGSWAQSPTPAVVDLIDLKAGDIPFSVVGPLPTSPRPTVFVFALDRKTSLGKSSFNRAALILRKTHDVLCVSLDMPAHGDDVRPGEKGGLPGWRTRLDKNEDLVADFATRFGRVLDELVAKGYTDPKRVAVIGISRGGFMALHLMAAHPGIMAVAAIAPAMDLSAVEGFKDLNQHPLTQSLKLVPLASRPNFQKPIWITVGNHDTIVGTNLCMDFVRAVAEAAPPGTVLRPVELHVMPGDDHRQPAGTHDKLAQWLGAQFSPVPTPTPAPKGG